MLSSDIFSEDNYGRWHATWFAFSWMAVGGCCAFLLFDVLRDIPHGGPTLRGAIISASVVGILLWQLWTAYDALLTVRDILNYEYKPVSAARIILVLVGSLLFGAGVIGLYHGALIGHVSALTYVLSPIVGLLVIVPACALVAGLAAWFVIYPRPKASS